MLLWLAVKGWCSVYGCWRHERERSAICRGTRAIFRWLEGEEVGRVWLCHLIHDVMRYFVIMNDKKTKVETKCCIGLLIDNATGTNRSGTEPNPFCYYL